MAKLETFDRKTSAWQGMWKNGKGYYASARLNLSDLRKYKGAIRIQMYDNKYYVPKGNKPKFCFRITDANEVDARTLEIEEYCNAKAAKYAGLKAAEPMVPLQKAIDIAIALVQDCEYGDSVDDLIGAAEVYMEEASVRAIDMDEE